MANQRIVHLWQVLERCYRRIYLNPLLFSRLVLSSECICLREVTIWMAEVLHL